MLDKARAISEDIVRIRREIHRHPELGYREERTSDLIARELEALGLSCRRGVAKTGVVAEIGSGGPTVALRADMDALPITEETGLPFASENLGIMHACGHDAHMAILLGASRLLKESSLEGTIRLLFQPSEENNEGDAEGYSGARRMLEEGALEGVDAVVGLHQAPMLPTGCISLRQGPVLAAADRLSFVVHGRSAHAGVNPEAGIDAVVIAAELITLLQTVVSRTVGPNDQAVVSIGTIEGGANYNVVADRVTLSGTTRALNDETYDRNIARIESICLNLARMHETTIDFRVEHAVPVTRNDPRITAIAKEAAAKIFPAEGIIAAPPMLGGEDFAYIAARIPSCFALLGTQNPQLEASSLHHPRMLLDEAALPLGASFLAQTALDLLTDFGK